VSKESIARRVEALEVEFGLAGPIKEALDAFDALKNELSPLLCPVCLESGRNSISCRTVSEW